MCNYYVYIGTLLQKQFVHVKLCNFCHSNHAGRSRPILDIFTCKPVLNEHSIASRTLIPRSQTTEQLKSHNKFQQLSLQTSFQLKFIVHCIVLVSFSQKGKVLALPNVFACWQKISVWIYEGIFVNGSEVRVSLHRPSADSLKFTVKILQKENRITSVN